MSFITLSPFRFAAVAFPLGFSAAIGLLACGSDPAADSTPGGVAGDDAARPVDAALDPSSPGDAGGDGSDGSIVTDATVDAGPVPTLAVGPDAPHTCVVFEDGRAKCWGFNGSGALGLGDLNDRGDQAGEMKAALPFVDLGAGRKVKSVAVGAGWTCAVLDTGALKCWGSNGSGQLGLGNGSNPGGGPGELGDNLPAVDLGPGRTALAVTAGHAHSCALLDNGAVKCFGFNVDGQLGRGDTTSRGGQASDMGANLIAVDLGPGRSATALASSQEFTCAILDNGSVKCWGDNSGAQLGLGDTNDRGKAAGEMGAALPAVDLGAGRTAKSIATGGTTACVILDNGKTKCWGGKPGSASIIGGYAPGTMGDVLPAVDFGVGRSATSISVGNGHVCAVLDDQTVKCWGSNLSGQLGQGSRAAVLTPALVDLGAGKHVQAVRAYTDFTCAVLTDATVKCWGSGQSGRLGAGDTNDRAAAAGEMGNALAPVELR